MGMFVPKARQIATNLASAFTAREKIGYIALNTFRHVLGNALYRLDTAYVKPCMPVFIDVTYRCNLHCRHCYRWKSGKTKELGLEEWKTVFAKLGKWLKRYEMLIVGGEPLLKNGIFEFIDAAADSGAWVSLISNGFIINNQLARKIHSSRLAAVSISLDGINPATHDRLRGVEGSHERAMKAISLLHKQNGKLRIYLSSIISKGNLDEVVPLALFAKKIGITGINFNAIMPPSTYPIYLSSGQPDSGIAEQSAFDPSNLELLKDADPQKVDTVVNELISLKQNGIAPILTDRRLLENIREYLKCPPSIAPMKCRIGFKSLFIDPFGNLRICNSMDRIGNLYESEPEQLWDSKEARAVRKKIRECERLCRLAVCNYVGADIVDKLNTFLLGEWGNRYKKRNSQPHR